MTLWNGPRWVGLRCQNYMTHPQQTTHTVQLVHTYVGQHYVSVTNFLTTVMTAI